jgi:hypothetical protein
MMDRIYADIESLIYMTADIPGRLVELFRVMEEQYQKQYKLILETTPEIDVIVSLDDTSTTIISPKMFEEYNLTLTNQRAGLAESYGRYYMHHSCGLIRDLLPVYAKTRMNGVHAFNRPPIGDVTFSEGRKMIGSNIAIEAGIYGGYKSDKDTIVKAVREVLADAKAAGNITLSLSSPDPEHTIDYLQFMMEEARKYQQY